jgi:hypothetical protein
MSAPDPHAASRLALIKERLLVYQLEDGRRVIDAFAVEAFFSEAESDA